MPSKVPPMQKYLMPLVILALSLCLTSCGLLKLPANLIRHTGRLLGVDNNSKDLPVGIKVSRIEEKSVERR